MAMSDARYKLLGGGQYPSECDEDAPVPHALPVPFCHCELGNQLAVVGILTIGLPRDAPGRRLFGDRSPDLELEGKRKDTRHKFI